MWLNRDLNFIWLDYVQQSNIACTFSGKKNLEGTFRNLPLRIVFIISTTYSDPPSHPKPPWARSEQTKTEGFNPQDKIAI